MMTYLEMVIKETSEEIIYKSHSYKVECAVIWQVKKFSLVALTHKIKHIKNFQRYLNWHMKILNSLSS